LGLTRPLPSPSWAWTLPRPNPKLGLDVSMPNPKLGSVHAHPQVGLDASALNHMCVTIIMCVINIIFSLIIQSIYIKNIIICIITQNINIKNIIIYVVIILITRHCTFNLLTLSH
jgi:hypothetical protein